MYPILLTFNLDHFLSYVIINQIVDLVEKQCDHFSNLILHASILFIMHMNSKWYPNKSRNILHTNHSIKTIIIII